MIELGAGFDMELTARENIFLNGAVLGHSNEFMEEHFEDIVEFAGLGKFLDSPIKNFSSGMKARLGFSVATMVDPEILIVDEVLSVGDYQFRKKCNERMEEMLSGGTTLLFVSHNIDQVKKLCTHALWLDHGRCNYVRKCPGSVRRIQYQTGTDFQGGTKGEGSEKSTENRKQIRLSGSRFRTVRSCIAHEAYKAGKRCLVIDKRIISAAISIRRTHTALTYTSTELTFSTPATGRYGIM